MIHRSKNLRHGGRRTESPVEISPAILLNKALHVDERSHCDCRRSIYETHEHSATVALEEWRTACDAPAQYSLRIAQPRAIGDRG